MQDRASKWKGLAWLLGACSLGIFLAVGLSPLAHLIPWSWEKALGKATQAHAATQACPGKAQSRALLQRLVARLYPLEPGDGDFSIEVRVVQNPELNAYATLGGVININSGLLHKAESPEELAGVLAHEITHVQHRHIMEGTLARLFTAQGLGLILGTGSAAQVANFFLNMSFSRRQESQADEGGLRRLQLAHIDNQGFKHFFERMEKSDSGSSFLSDHPSNDARIAMVAKFQNQGVQPILSIAEWKILKSYCP